MHTALVLGGGSFATALAQTIAPRTSRVLFWVRRTEVAEHINTQRHHPQVLSQYTLHPNVQATCDLATACRDAQWIISALPSGATREVFQVLAQQQRQPCPILLGTKGIETDTLHTMHDVVLDVLGAPWRPFVTVLSGPSFAEEMMQNQPTAVVFASEGGHWAEQLAQQLHTQTFRPYSSQDVIGVEMGGALKNVLALAAGAATGLGYGHNTRAALLTRGLMEITRVAVAQGAAPLTLMGLAGMGDLLLTCTGHLSRNRAVGERIGQGFTLQQACAQIGQVAEGVSSAKAAYRLVEKLGIHAPILRSVYQVLFEAVPIQQAIEAILKRRPGPESPW